MKPYVVAYLGALAAVPAGLRCQQPALTSQDSAFQALNRLAYGPRPGEVTRVATAGVMQWIDRQLSPDRIDDDVLAQRERQFTLLDYDRGDLAAMYAEAQRERRDRKQSAAQQDTTPTPTQRKGRRLAGEFADLAVVRAVLSERQLYEVMVDFWFSHFNVYLAKGADRFLTPDYVEHTIRPHAMGKFADLLIATAKSPAMLFYLDNWESVAPGATPPAATRMGVRPFFGRRPLLFAPPGDPARMDSLRPRAAARQAKGLNENYARELLELHTLGVDGGYTQQDVIAVARIFTGWSIRRPQRGGDFEFHDWAHDRGEKQVLGVNFPEGHGMDEGIRLLKMLASHPATMHHVSRPENVRAKVKSPLEFVASAARAVGAEPDTSPRLAQVVARLGEPLYLHVAPDGYPEREDAWVNSGALLDRMNAAVALAAGKLPGLTVNLDAFPSGLDTEQLIGAVDAQILGGKMTENSKRVVRNQLSDIGDPVQARALAVGLAIGGPEFQRQ